MPVDRVGSLLKISGVPRFFLHENILSVQTFLHKALYASVVWVYILIIVP